MLTKPGISPDHLHIQHVKIQVNMFLRTQKEMVAFNSL